MPKASLKAPLPARRAVNLRPLSLEIASDVVEKRPRHPLLVPPQPLAPNNNNGSPRFAAGSPPPLAGAARKASPLCAVRSPILYEFTSLPTYASPPTRSRPGAPRAAAFHKPSPASVVAASPPLDAPAEAGEEQSPPQPPVVAVGGLDMLGSELPSAAPSSEAARILEQRHRALRPAVRQRIKNSQRSARWLEPPPTNGENVYALHVGRPS